MFKKTKLCTSLLLAFSGGAVLTSLPALAQERIEVTGSRIRVIETETAQPIQKITQEQIQKSGLTTVGDIISSMSAAGSPEFSKGSVLTSNTEQGGQYINLRNLGSERLLVLVNGKRWTQTVGGYTDVSTIPAAMIERVEILKDGASSVYGSDAIAGVVNFILKRDMKGGQLSIYGGVNEKGDGKAQDYSIAYGTSTDNASIMLGATFNKQGTVWAKDREITAYSYGPEFYNAGFGTGPWGRIRQVGPTGGATGFNYYLNHTGSYNGDGTGENSRDPNSYHAYAGAEEDTFNSSSQMMFQSPTEMGSIFARGTIDITPDIRFSSTAMFADRKSTRQIAGYPLNSGSQSAYRVYIDKDSYFNPYGNQVQGEGNGEDLFFYRRTIEVPRATTNHNKTLHVDGGLEGELNVGGKAFDWNVAYSFSKVDGTEISTGNLNLLNLKKALGPSFMNASGQVQCGTPTAPIPLAQCVPWDILGGPSASTPEALAYVMSTGQSTYGSLMRSMTADMSGELFRLPAGGLGMAVGVERRSVSGYDRPGQFEQSGYSTDLAGNATTGKYSVDEAYVELEIPLLKGLPAVELLSLNLASRYSDYSNFGSTTNSKASFIYKPHKDIMARGTYAEGFRAPNLGDTFGGGSQSFDSYMDPCDSVNGEAANDPAVMDRCLAAGVPVGYRQVNQAGAPVPPGGGQGTSPFQAGAGNAFLKPETATTKTLGLVINPSALPGFSATLDWYQINVKNRITAISAAYVLNQCYVANVPEFCTSIRRDAVSGMVTNLERGNANLGELEASGFDMTMAYAMPATSFGRFGVRMEASYVDTYRIKSTAESDWQEYAGEYATYRTKANFGVDWSMGDWSATFGTRYYGEVKVQCWDSETNCSDPGASASWGTDVNKLGPVVYNDLSVGYKLPWKANILLGVNNVFAVKPRIILDANYAIGSAPGSGNSSSSSVDPDLPIDRFFFLRYNQQF